jgi:hypothetical protein
MSSKVLASKITAIVLGGSAVVGLLSYLMYRKYYTSQKKVMRTERVLSLKRYKRGKLKTEQVKLC